MERIRQIETGTYHVESFYTDDDGAEHHVHVPVSLEVQDGAGSTVFEGEPVLQGGGLSIDLPAATLSRLDIYRFNWSATLDGSAVAWTSLVEIVGGYLYEIAELRAQDRTFTVDKYPTDVLREVRSRVEDVIEGPRAANVAFVPRSARTVIDGSGRPALALPHLNIRSVYSVKINGISWTPEQVASITPDDGVLWLGETAPIYHWPEGHRNIEIHYTHGHDRAPGAITRAALLLSREYIVKSDVPGRATATSIGDQLFRLTIAGRDGVTGLPDVDAAIDQFGRKTFSVR